ncbi:uro-adherence factor A-like isoform X2 [Oscarella lobularis]|uniref:uro-adherence factor A-like isoform X2 n=1 Tax=Oscarella lobularis TaxID=121494 RepID=UPI00331382DE
MSAFAEFLLDDVRSMQRLQACCVAESAFERRLVQQRRAPSKDVNSERCTESTEESDSASSSSDEEDVSDVVNLALKEDLDDRLRMKACAEAELAWRLQESAEDRPRNDAEVEDEATFQFESGDSENDDKKATDNRIGFQNDDDASIEVVADDTTEEALNESEPKKDENIGKSMPVEEAGFASEDDVAEDDDEINLKPDARSVENEEDRDKSEEDSNVSLSPRKDCLASEDDVAEDASPKRGVYTVTDEDDVDSEKTNEESSAGSGNEEDTKDEGEDESESDTELSQTRESLAGSEHEDAAKVEEEEDKDEDDNESDNSVNLSPTNSEDEATKDPTQDAWSKEEDEDEKGNGEEDESARLSPTLAGLGSESDNDTPATDAKPTDETISAESVVDHGNVLNEKPTAIVDVSDISNKVTSASSVSLDLFGIPGRQIVPWFVPKTLRESNLALREEHTQKLVLENLTEITQRENNDLRRYLATETTSRRRAESQAADLKLELKQSQREVSQLKERVKELEESMQGTMALVRKLEQQSASSLLSRGGIDYMLEAKLASNRANEAEQKNQLLQVELLQSQSEVKRLLDQMTETNRHRSEMVSSKVHGQLMAIADEKARESERKVVELLKEIELLKYEVKMKGGEKPTGSSLYRSGLSSELSYPTLGSFSPYSTSTSGPTGFSMTDPMSYLSRPLGYPSSSGSLGLGTSFDSFSSSSYPTLGGGGGDAGSFSAAKPSMGEVGSSAFSSTLGPPKSSTLGGIHSELTTSETLPSTKSPKSVKKDQYSALPDFESSLPKLSLSSGTSGNEPPPPPEQSLPTETSTSTSKPQNSDSSDWSSDEEESKDSGGLMPSSHTSLLSNWEWRATHGLDSPGKTRRFPSAGNASGEESATSSSPKMPPKSPGKRPPPPVAPKPAWARRQLSFQGGFVEKAVSFDDNPFEFERAPSLTSKFARPKGPFNRRRPTRARPKLTEGE